jgi:hypothetical protein
MLRRIAVLLALNFMFPLCPAAIRVMPDSRELVASLDELVLPAFTCESLPAAEAFALWKKQVESSLTVNMIVQETGEGEKGTIKLDVRGLTAFHVLSLLSAQSGCDVVLKRNVVYVRIP